MTLCKYCDSPIDFDDWHVGSSGRKIPLDVETRQPHMCAFRPIKRDRCYNCGKEIFFDSGMRNPAHGKLIPQDMWGNHKCKV
jgi:hypothetical protein